MKYKNTSDGRKISGISWMKIAYTNIALKTNFRRMSNELQEYIQQTSMNSV